MTNPGDVPFKSQCRRCGYLRSGTANIHSGEYRVALPLSCPDPEECERQAVYGDDMPEVCRAVT